MNITKKIEEIEKIYKIFDGEVKEFKKGAVCKKGCADCCKQMARIELTTIEALRIGKRIETFEESIRAYIKKRLKKDFQKKKKHLYTTCPFLTKEDSCLIYTVRPFSCRWIYSLKKCNGGPPLIHRQVFEIAKRTIEKIKKLDYNGYSGHISIILWLLENKKFKENYLSGRIDKKITHFFSLYITPNFL
ncbi:MAG TPA: YkgJ family cysteine cluster protein [Candidatus Desulfofervidus auxilii]|uniref:YkgJ family cysteine cluster protein n=1 Tax=Desulfofervidus auxilii TaxID=1621989 RepID=A0A7V0IA67_DESA2|nr:YkgJ family cysteine cluster protein [Candidatus Desulfofervidus auxilii]